MKTIILAVFVLAPVSLTTYSVRASICVAPPMPEAFDRAEAVFVGKISTVVVARGSNGSSFTSSDYVVKFEVEAPFKKTLAKEITVLWRSEMTGCSYFPVGEVGERYLVYADPSKSDLHDRKLPEVAVFNRTSKLPPKPATLFVSHKPPTTAHFSLDPELNRADGSSELQALRRIKDCGCLQQDTLSACLGLISTSGQSNSSGGVRSSSTASSCCTCLHQGMTLVTP